MSAAGAGAGAGAALLAALGAAVTGHRGALREVAVVPALAGLGLPAAGALGGPCRCCFAPSLVAVLDGGRVAALAAPSLPPLFAHALALVLRARDEGPASAPAAGDAVLERDIELELATLAVLLINPGVHAAWAARKRLLVSGSIGAAGELWATAIVLSAHPKGGLPFAHRSWVHSVAAAATAGGIGAGALASDLAVCEAAARAHPRNYYAWTHRLRTARLLGAVDGGRQRDALVAAELDASETYVRMHPGDHCALHYRAALVELAAGPPGTAVPAEAADRELRLADRLAAAYEGHDSLWRYRRRALAWAVAAPRRADDAAGAAARVLAADAHFADARLALASATLAGIADRPAPGSLQDRAMERWELERRHATAHARHLAVRYPEGCTSLNN